MRLEPVPLDDAPNRPRPNATAPARPEAFAAESLRPLGRAELRTLLAIDLAGGEVCLRREGGRERAATLGAFGGAEERFPASTVRALIAAGRLRLARFQHGGAVYALRSEPEARAAFRRRPRLNVGLAIPPEH